MLSKRGYQRLLVDASLITTMADEKVVYKVVATDENHEGKRVD